MENIVIYPQSNKQYAIIKAFLEEMKIRFKSEPSDYESLEEWQKERIETGLRDIEEGKTISAVEVQKKVREYCCFLG